MHHLRPTSAAITHPKQKEGQIVDPILEQIRASLTTKLEERAAATSAQNALIEVASKREDKKLTDLESRDFNMRTDAKVTLDTDITELRAQETKRQDELTRDANASTLRSELGGKQERAHGDGTIGREERTYRPDSPHSFFRDSYRLQISSDFTARDRLERNYREAIVEKEFVQRSEQRAIGTSAIASLVVPQYLSELNAPVLRKGRPVANMATSLPIGEQGMSFVIPRGTTGATAAAQATQNSAISNTDQVWADLTVNIATIAGEQDVSRQILERGVAGTDQIIYNDLVRAFAAELDRQVIYGLGTGNEMLGLLKTSGIFAATAFGAALSYTNFLSKLAGQIAAIADAGAGFEGNAIIMSPRRWGWLTALLDTTGRPLVSPAANSYNAYGLNLNPGAYSGKMEGPGYKTVGEISGLPVITAGNIPKTVGTLNEDLVAIVDTANLLLWEDGDGMPKELRFDQTKGNTLTTVLAVYGFCGFTAGRYPTAVGSIGGLDTVGGNGLIAPTF